MATLTVTQLTQGSSLTTSFVNVAVSSSNGDAFLNTGREVVMFQNSSSQGGGSAITVTFAGQSADNLGGAASLHNLTVSVASSSFGMLAVGPFRPGVFNDANGLVQMTYSAAGLRVQVVSVAPAS